MEALSRLVEIIFVDFLIGVQVGLLVCFAYGGFEALAWVAYGGFEAKETTNAIRDMNENWPLLLVIFAVVYILGASVTRVYDFLGERLWNAISGGNKSVFGTERQKYLGDGKWSTNRFKVLLEEGRAGDYLGYMRTLTRVTTGVFFNSVTLLILLFLNYDKVPWRIYPFALALVILGGLSYAIASTAFDQRMDEASTYLETKAGVDPLKPDTRRGDR